MKYFGYAMDQLLNDSEISSRKLPPHRVARILVVFPGNLDTLSGGNRDWLVELRDLAYEFH